MRYCRTALTMLIALCASCTAIFAQVSREWKKTNGPNGAQIMALAVDKDGGAYAALHRGDIYYAPPTPGPANWQLLGGELPQGPAGGTIWHLAVADEPGNRVIYAASNNSAFRLAPGGSAWTEVKTGLETGAIHKIVANSAGTLFCTTIEGKLFRLDKDAMSWQEVPTSLEKPSNMVIGKSNALFVSVRDGGVIRSTDNGATWTTVVEPAGKPGTNPAAILASSPSGDIYYLFRSFKRSTDNGATWTELPPTPVYAVNKMAVGSNNEIYVGTAGPTYYESGFYMRKDGDMQWTQPILELKENHIIQAMAVGDRGYLATGTMIFRTVNHGATWEYAANGLPFSTIQFMDVNWPGTIAAVHGTRLSISTDRGASWMDRGASWMNTDDLYPTAIRWSSNGDLLMGIGYVLKRSLDSGITWTKVLSTNQMIRDIEVDPTGRMAVLVSSPLAPPGSAPGEGSILFSPNNGAIWMSGNIGLPDATGAVADITPGPFGTLFAAVNPVGIFRSLDGGKTWEKIYDKNDRPDFQKITVHYGTGDIMAVGEHSISRYSQQPSQSYDRIYDETVEFLDITSSTTGYTVAATNNGVMVSPDGSDQFVFELQAPEGRFLCVDVDAEGRFYAGVEDNGMWRTESDIIASAGNTAAGFRGAPSIALSPNPTADRLTVQYTLKEAKQVAIALHDLSGRAVRDLPGTYREAGDHTVNLDLADLPAGTYFVGLKLGNITSSTAPFVIRR